MSTQGTGIDVVGKGNDYAIEALKQLLALSTVVLALTITFLKDALGEARAQAQATYLLPFAWALFLIAIWEAWVAIGHAARAMASGQINSYVFEGRRLMVKIPHWAFFTALLLLAAFAFFNLKLVFGPSPPKVVDEIRAHRFIAVDCSGKTTWIAP